MLGWRAELASTLNNLGWLIASTGRKNEARDVLRRGVALLEQCVAEQPNVVDFRSNLAQLLNALGEQLEGNEARAAFARARALGEAIVAEVPTVPRFRSDLVTTLRLAGNLESNLKAYDAAVASSGQAVVRARPWHATTPTWSSTSSISQIASPTSASRWSTPAGRPKPSRSTSVRMRCSRPTCEEPGRHRGGLVDRRLIQQCGHGAAEARPSRGGHTRARRGHRP